MATKTKKRPSSKSSAKSSSSSSSPAKWATKGYSGQQPWEKTKPDELGDRPPGAPDDVSEVVLAHDKPILSSGSAGPPVFELCELLAELGYETSVSRGQNAFGVLGPAELAAVAAFRDEYGVREDPSAFGGSGEAFDRLAAAHVGPWTWEGLLRATGRDS